MILTEQSPILLKLLESWKHQDSSFRIDLFNYVVQGGRVRFFDEPYHSHLYTDDVTFICVNSQTFFQSPPYPACYICGAQTINISNTMHETCYSCSKFAIDVLQSDLIKATLEIMQV